MPLHISKVAVGCASFSALRNRQARRMRDGFVPVLTRFRPKRADELIGGSLFWIVKHRIIARQEILGFEDAAERRTLIRLDPAVVPLTAAPKRAHQGWRYLNAEDAPADLGEGVAGILELPPAMARQLATLALI
ncbi:DUF1489 family protein [Allosphingosinicella indica]|uniref:DUF1489 family protein n=1 Tax=Allosphingosinicella indica TaxID=941907 RepID=A0A1X7G391_9SPHN|nr:DUF1489 domain-containing protein [Allosphingosinicella indica]SMF63301.1 hypothetical protein SAMN06295910_1060 [Allosphingosinicella indica]